MRSLVAAVLALVACEAGADLPPGDAPSTEPRSGGAQVAQPSGTAAGAEDVPPASLAPWLDGIDFEDRLWYGDLPGRLDEVSGLAFTPDGRLFAHDDERGRIHEIDVSDGSVGKRFDLGAETVRGDFEGIAVVGDRFFLVESIGILYEFREGPDDAHVAVRRSDTGLGDGCEIEGLDFDPIEEALLFACKTTAPPDLPVTIHRLPLDPDEGPRAALYVDRVEIAARGIARDFAPSGVALSPTGSILILSGREDAIVEVDREGRVLAAVALRSGRHPQSEGIAVGPDGTLYVADEKNGKEPRLTAYGPRGRERAR